MLKLGKLAAKKNLMANNNYFAKLLRYTTLAQIWHLILQKI
jgi:hypothetical protein